MKSKVIITNECLNMKAKIKVIYHPHLKEYLIRYVQYYTLYTYTSKFPILTRLKKYENI